MNPMCLPQTAVIIITIAPCGFNQVFLKPQFKGSTRQLQTCYISLIIRLGKFGPLDYSQMSPLQIRMLSNDASFVTVVNLSQHQTT